MKSLPKQLRVALLVDNPTRDLPGLVLVARDLFQNGNVVYLVPMNLRIEEVWSLAPDFVLLNHFRTVYEEWVNNMLKAGIKVGVLDTEGSVFSPVPKNANVMLEDKTIEKEKESAHPYEEYALSMARSKELRHSLDLFCSWSNDFANYTIDSSWYQKHQVVVTGPPRMDFYAQNWKHAALLCSKHIGNYPKPIVLINSSFTLANPRFKSAQEEAQMMINKFNYDKTFVEKWLETQKKALVGLVATTNRLALQFQNATFIYRPHPFEDDLIYNEKLNKLNNLKLVREGTVDGWILRSTALIHWGSSTSMEAALAGVPAFSLGWLPIHLPIPGVEDVSVSCHNENELVEHIGKVINGTYMLPKDISSRAQSVLESSFFKNDGLAHKRVSEAIIQCFHKKASSSPDKSACRRFFFTPQGPKNYYRKKIETQTRKLLNLPPDWSFRKIRRTRGGKWWKKTNKYFSLEHVENILQAADTAERLRGKTVATEIRVKPVEPRLDSFIQGQKLSSLALYTSTTDTNYENQKSDS